VSGELHYFPSKPINVLATEINLQVEQSYNRKKSNSEDLKFKLIIKALVQR
jgi:hypothetical protein